ncbi:hypothetical protein HDU92_002242 [Lobulomyces angularis]|nr:hypothetical protein HDU92_002242 [Lobulomyces angularis]
MKLQFIQALLSTITLAAISDEPADEFSTKLQRQPSFALRSQPSQPRSLLTVEHVEEDYLGEITFETNENVNAVWLDNLNGLLNVDCSTTGEMKLTFDSPTNAKLPEVWGTFPITALISAKYSNCLGQEVLCEEDNICEVKEALGVQVIEGINLAAATNENDLVLSTTKQEFFDDTVTETSFNFASTNVESDDPSLNSLQKRFNKQKEFQFSKSWIDKDVFSTAYLDLQSIFGPSKISPESKITCRNCTIDYRLGWKISGHIRSRRCKTNSQRKCHTNKMSYELTGGGKATFDLKFALSGTHTVDIITIPIIPSIPLGPSAGITIPGIFNAGFFFEMGANIAIDIVGKIEFTAGIDITQNDFTFTRNSRNIFGSEADQIDNLNGGKVDFNLHKPTFKAAAKFIPKLSINPTFSAKIELPAVKNLGVSIKLGMGNELQFPMVVDTSEILEKDCLVSFALTYHPSIFVSAKALKLFQAFKELTNFPTFELVKKRCIKFKDGKILAQLDGNNTVKTAIASTASPQQTFVTAIPLPSSVIVPLIPTTATAFA